MLPHTNFKKGTKKLKREQERATGMATRLEKATWLYTEKLEAPNLFCLSFRKRN